MIRVLSYRNISVMLVAGVLVACGGDGNDTQVPQLRILSSDAARVSGGTALLEVASSTTTGTVNLLVNGKDMSGSSVTDPVSGKQKVLVTGLVVGDNQLTAIDHGGGIATLTLKNYPLSGPIFSGAQQIPFVCETQTFRLPDGSALGAATGPECSVPTKGG